MSNLSSQISQNQIETFATIIKGFSNYCTKSPAVHQYEADLLLELGNTKLYHFGGEGSPLIFIPSLINRSYILDLERNSFLKIFSTKHSVYLIDWDSPNNEEADFNTDAYIEQRIKPMVDYVAVHSQTIPNIAGYCMGGILALLFAAQYPEKVERILTIAMPYNFNAKNFIKIGTATLEKALGDTNIIEPDFLKAIFYLNNFAAVNQKYCDFSDGISGNAFQVESWVNDGVPLSKKVFLEFVENLINQNSLCINKTFQSALTTYDLSAIKHKILAVAGEYDSIVSPENSYAVETLSSNVSLITLPTGHIGQILKYSNVILSAMQDY